MVHRRRGRRSARLWRIPLALLLLLSLAGFAAESYGPSLAERAIAQAVTAQLHRPARVRLTPGALADNLQGRFARLQIALADVVIEGLRVRSVRLDWRDGRVDLLDLLHGRLRVLAIGRLSVAGTVGQEAIAGFARRALAQELPSAAAADLPRLAVAPGGISLRGSFTVAGVVVPYAIGGALRVQPGGEGLTFVAQTLNGGPMPFDLPPIPLLTAQNLPSLDGVRLSIASVRLLEGAVSLTLRGSLGG